MGDYTIDELNNLFFNVYFKQFEINYPDGSSRIVNSGEGDDRFETFVGNSDVIFDDYQCESFERLLHLVKINEKVRAEGYEGLTTLKKEYQYHMRNLIGIKIIKRSKTSRVLFFSCVPKHRISITEGEVRKMKNFLEKYFTDQYFFKVAFNIESGKHENKPNLHFHFICIYNKNGSKNFRSRILYDAWNKHYPNNPLNWERGKHVGIDCVKCNVDFMVKDKLAYFHNESKGSHTNFLDLDYYRELGDWSEYR